MPIKITVKPGSKVQKVVKSVDGSLTVYCHARAHDGEANAAVIKLVADFLDLPKTSLKITHGAKSRHKTIETN